MGSADATPWAINPPPTLLIFSSAKIDPSTLKVLVNNEDVTKRIDIKQNTSSVRIDYKLLTDSHCPSLQQGKLKKVKNLFPPFSFLCP